MMIVPELVHLAQEHRDRFRPVAGTLIGISLTHLVQALAIAGHAPKQVTTDGHDASPRAIRETLPATPLPQLLDDPRPTPGGRCR